MLADTYETQKTDIPIKNNRIQITTNNDSPNLKFG